jgi:D-alanyl-D-alanine carboxypeptidase (penicillin-binding protein 5/6)
VRTLLAVAAYPLAIGLFSPVRRALAGALLGVVALAPPTTAKPHAWILVDLDRGVVLDAGNDRTPLPPASLTKLLTAVIATGQLSPSDTLTVSARAAGEPATKINMKPGQVWTFQDALYSLLLSSANDAAAAIGERVGGTLEGFAGDMQRAGSELGLQDHPQLQDPAGLDDSFSVDGGNLLSARDLAIIARAALAQPLLAQVVATPVYYFTGPDGVHHRLGNHNQLLKTYRGAIGVKTGYTAKAGENLIAAARRGSRSMLAVVLGAPNLYQDASTLLDEGFASAPTATGTGDALPAVVMPDVAPPAATAAGAPPVPAPVAAAQHSGGGPNRAMLAVGLVLVVGTIATGLRRQQISRRRAQRRREHGRRAR